MNVYKEIKQIAMANSRVQRLATLFAETGKIDCDGLVLEAAYLIHGCREKNGHLYQNGDRLDNYGLVDDDYYCHQMTGYLGDDFYGAIYFKTNVPGEFVAVPFAM